MLGDLFGWRRESILEADRASKQNAEEGKTITLCSDDSDVTRAMNIMRAMGLALNTTAMAMVPYAAQAIEAYRKLDREAREQSQGE